MKFSNLCGVVVAGAMILPVTGIGVAQAQQTQDRQDRQERQQQRTQRQAQPGQTQRAGQATRGQADQTDRQTQQILASDLKLANEAEIQLAQLGQSEAQNQQVKQYAQQMIQSHRQINQQLVQAVPQARQASLDRAGASQAGQRQADANQAAGGEDVYGMAAEPRGSGQADKLMKIHQQLAQKMLEQTTEMLQEKQGAEFDKAFMGCQIGMHQAMLARLSVYQEHLGDQAQEVLQQAEEETQQHLEQAQQIMQQLEQAS